MYRGPGRSSLRPGLAVQSPTRLAVPRSSKSASTSSGGLVWTNVYMEPSGDEEIVFERHPTGYRGGSACAVCLDGILAGKVFVTKNVPVKVKGTHGLHLTVAVKPVKACDGIRSFRYPLFRLLDHNPIMAEQIRTVQRGLGALRP